MNTEYKCVTTVDGIRDYIGGSRIVAFDFETAPDDPYREEDKAALDPARAHIVGCSFSVKEGTGIYVPIAHRVGTNIDKDAFFEFLTAFLMDKTLIKIAHNIAFESSMAYARGIVIQAPVYDTICASQMSLKSIYEFRKPKGKIRVSGTVADGFLVLRVQFVKVLSVRDARKRRERFSEQFLRQPFQTALVQLTKLVYAFKAHL